MARLNALRLAQALKERLVDFSRSDNYVRDAGLSELCAASWSGPAEEGGLCSDLWVEGSIPSRSSGKSLHDAMESELFPTWLGELLDKNKVLPRHRELYWHQWESLTSCHETGASRPAVILSAGTGAGKTESFLLPILADLARAPRRPGGGCRAIVLYPMNALVNDQVDRLYSWLAGQQQLTLCHFTSETPEDWGKAERRRFPRFEWCRHRTRQRARGLEDAQGRSIKAGSGRQPPPDILITNYSMLEYMLCRPQDQVFFGPDLRAVVLDEAHLYTGTLAAEMTLLLRRLYDKCGSSANRVLQFATSATIGTGTEEELRTFASTLFGKPADQVIVIQGKKARSSLPEVRPPSRPVRAAELAEVTFEQPTIIMTEDGQEELVQSSECCDELLPLLAKLVGASELAETRRECGDTPARLLRVVGHAPQVHRLEEVLRSSAQIALPELAERIWGRRGSDEEQATTLLLNLASAAREDLYGVPLLPHRLHLMLRPAEGFSVCLNRECSADRRCPDAGALLAGREDVCPACGHAVMALYHCRCCGEHLLAAVTQGARFRPPFPFEKEQPAYYSLHPHPRLKANSVHSHGGEHRELHQVTDKLCPTCDADLEDNARPLASQTNLVLSILAETLFAELPPLACRYEESNRILPARGRRLLAFSDSRAEAARLGPRLRRQHDFQLVRSAIVRLFEGEPGAAPALLEYYQREINRLEENMRDPNFPAAARKEVEKELAAKRQALRSTLAGGRIESWAERLAQDEALDELLYEDSGENHQADSYTDRSWRENSRNIRGRAADFLGLELVSLPPRHRINAETIGAVEVVYPDLESLEAPASFLGSLPTETLRQRLREVWPTLLSSFCDDLRRSRAVTLGSYDQDAQFQQNRLIIGRWVTLTDFVGSTERGLRRQFSTNVLREAGCEEAEATELAPELLGAVFKQLHEHALENVNDRREPKSGEFPWLERTLRHTAGRAPEDGLRLIFPELALRKPGRLYICSKTGHLWPRSVLGCAPERGSRGTLEPIDPEKIDPASFVGRARREYLSDSHLFKIGLWAEEHSAQLAPQEARRLQELFRRGIRNLLSATTTLELGIDIGGLSGAFLSNVPPGKASYLQRAGRVGRRADGSSVVVTCARSRPYDREVFRRIGDFLARPLRQPRVFLERDRIARRHFHAWLMGSFFEQLYHPDRHSVGAMSAFGHMGSFCGQPLPPWWEPGVPDRPRLSRSKDPLDYERPEWWDPEAGDVLAKQYLRWVSFAEQQPLHERLDGLFRATAFEHPSSREGLFQDAIKLFERALATWRSDYAALLKSWKSTKALRQANAIRYQLKTLHGVTVIEALSNAQYLPRYGFPIGLHKLRVIAEDQARKGKTREEDQYRLERSSLLALREYVPGSQLLVGGKLITSRGLLKHWTGANVNESFGMRGGSTRCENQHFYYWYSDKPDVCPICDGRPSGTIDQLLFPKHGFTTAAWDPPKRSTDTDRVGSVQTETIAFARQASKEAALELKEDSFAGVPGISAVYKEEAEILVKNTGDDELGFAVCVACGYAESERRKQKGKLPKSFENHAPLHATNPQASCRKDKGDSTALRNQILCAAEPTDILMLDLSGPLAGRADAETLARSLAAALHLAGARLLQLDSRELGHMAVPVGSSYRAWGAVVFDNVPGGAGHVLELMKNGRAWLEATRDLLHGSPEHHEQCQQACLDCLMTFDVQSNFSDLGPQLDRRAALAFLETLLGAGEEAGPLPPVEDLPGTPADERSGLPVLDFSRLGRGEEAPVTWRTLNGEQEPNHFLARLDTDSVSRQVERGTWCLFRRDVPARELPKEGQLVMLCDPHKLDPEHGPLVVRRLKYSPMGADGEIRKVVVKLLPDTRDLRYQRWTLELSPEEWETWTPYAVLVQPLAEDG